ncbi:hypothetical protein [Paenibacillus sp. GCM10012306]|uniref:hypothetical protein n=1 Tax=Paenibacillus sp. GCM10012306 TaxID=3317342 RepID=UPI00360FA589
MLKKLIKYDFKSTMRYMIPLYVIILLFTVLARLVTHVSGFEGLLGFIPIVIKLTYELMLAAAIIITYILQAVRYYSHLVTDEGYLTFTLPTAIRNLTISKLVTAVSWNLATMLLVLTSIGIVFYSEENKRAFTAAVEELFQQGAGSGSGSGLNTTMTILLVCIIFIITSLTIHLFIYTSIALGQVLMSKNRLAGTFVAGIVIYISIQLLMVVILLPIMFMLDLNTEDSGNHMILLMAICALFQIFICVLMYKAVNHMFSKRLNLE